MEEGLLLNITERERDGEEGKDLLTWSLLKEEMKKVVYLAGPMVAVQLSQYLIQVISTMMVGHLSELYLSSTAIATTFVSFTGFSLLLGMASALETLCGQAYGAQQYQKLGVYTSGAIVSLLLMCIPLSLMWISVGQILTFFGQDPLISVEAGKYATWLIPGLFAYAALQPLLKFLQSQSLILPMLLTSVATLCFHIPLSWVLVFKTRLGNVGAALAISISFWLNVISVAVYVQYSPSYKGARLPLSREAFRGIGQFFRLGIPCALMVCLERWSFEILVLLSGLLPNPELEASVLSVCLTTTTLLYTIPYGLGGAVSTRVSNELGAGKPQAAHVAVYAVMSMDIMVTVIVTTSLLASRYILGYAYSSEKEVTDYFTGMVPLICASVVMDSLEAVLSGVARGCGWQYLGAYVNLGAFYLAGIPLAAFLGFYLQGGGKGLWTGILTGSIVQVTLLILITSRTNWQKQAIDAKERIFDGRS